MRNNSRTIKLLYHRDGPSCFYCGKNMMNFTEYTRTKGRLAANDIKRAPVNYPTINHILPKTMGGVSKLYNLVVACAGCNKRKGDRVLEIEVPGFDFDLSHPCPCPYLFNEDHDSECLVCKGSNAVTAADITMHVFALERTIQRLQKALMERMEKDATYVS